MGIRDIKEYINSKRELVNAFLDSYFTPPIKPIKLNDAMVYSLMAGGKRLRPILCIASYEACGGKAEEIVSYASALEFIHTYSLIHDDLPAMDNDDLRRGRLTNHKVYGEGMAILAGDGLLTEAFAILSTTDHCSESGFMPPSSSLLRIINSVAKAAGLHGMVAGQAQDLLSEDLAPEEQTLAFIHSHKTAALIGVSVKMGAMLADAPEEAIIKLTGYGANIGLAFQVVDDVLDLTESTETLGKPSGSDERKKKMTYPSLYGIQESKKRAESLISSALACLEGFDDKAWALRDIAAYMLNRKN